MTFKNLIATLIMLGFIACTKEETPETVACSEEKYDTAFSVKAGEVYCFTDDTELKVVALDNGFCPCPGDCIWQGQLVISMEWTLSSGETLEYRFNTEAQTIVNDPLPDGLLVSYEIGDFTFEEPCSTSVPSPEIIEAIIMVSK